MAIKLLMLRHDLVLPFSVRIECLIFSHMLSRTLLLMYSKNYQAQATYLFSIFLLLNHVCSTLRNKIRKWIISQSSWWWKYHLNSHVEIQHGYCFHLFSSQRVNKKITKNAFLTLNDVSSKWAILLLFATIEILSWNVWFLRQPSWQYLLKLN